MIGVKSFQRGVSGKAQAAEHAAFSALGKTLIGGKPLVSPAGFDAGFPDFAYRIKLSSGKIVDLHYEYKADYKAQMGSMRDWHFDGKKFITPDTNSESKQQLIDIINKTPQAITNGKRLLKDLKTYFHDDVKKIYSGSLTIIKDKDTRKALAQEFANETDNFQIANINGSGLGQKIIGHYKTKFKKNLKPRSDASVLFMMLKDKIWLVDTTGSLSRSDMDDIASQHELTKLDPLRDLSAKLEVRIQPRGLNSPGKHASIDVMASFRLSKAPPGGGKVI